MNKQAFLDGYASRIGELMQDPRVQAGLVGGVGGAALGGLLADNPWQGAALGGLGGGALGAGGMHLATDFLGKQRHELFNRADQWRANALKDVDTRLGLRLSELEERAKNITATLPLAKARGEAPITAPARNLDQTGAELTRLLGG